VVVVVVDHFSVLNTTAYCGKVAVSPHKKKDREREKKNEERENEVVYKLVYCIFSSILLELVIVITKLYNS
jgi:hypothetical protein